MIYLDYNSTTPVAPQVLEAMLPYFTEKFGNASSKTHAFGWMAADAVEQARQQVADLINAERDQIIFTSGATEAINLAIKGVAQSYHSKGNHLVTVKTEHHAVLDVCKRLEQTGMEITYLDVNRDGLIDLNELKNAITDNTILVSVMMANNETGVIHDLYAISEIVHQKNSLLMSDATQAIGKMRVDVTEAGIDLLCLSAHKLYGPKGTGALYIRRKNPRVSLTPQMDGGGHERGLRSGTLNVTGIVGLGKACELAQNLMWDDGARISKLRTILEQTICDHQQAFINGSIKNRLPNTTNICFKNFTATDFIKQLNDVAVATGSACTSALNLPSHVLKAMGLTDAEAQSSIRFSLGRYTTEEEILEVLARIRQLKQTAMK